MTRAPISAAERSDNAPPSRPIADRFAATMNTSDAMHASRILVMIRILTFWLYSKYSPK